MQIRRSIRVGPEGCAPGPNDAAFAGCARQSVTSQPRLQPFSSWRSLKVLLVWLCAAAGSIKRAASSGSTRDRTVSSRPSLLDTVRRFVQSLKAPPFLRENNVDLCALFSQAPS
eukprot:m.19523 g.19523  ORF g.19523 m.19523 type:complete len:114 (-) comp5450_c0_seq2:995-1336(-)